jgi:hypothetical protein
MAGGGREGVTLISTRAYGNTRIGGRIRSTIRRSSTGSPTCSRSWGFRCCQPSPSIATGRSFWSRLAASRWKAGASRCRGLSGAAQSAWEGCAALSFFPVWPRGNRPPTLRPEGSRLSTALRLIPSRRALGPMPTPSPSGEPGRRERCIRQQPREPEATAENGEVRGIANDWHSCRIHCRQASEALIAQRNLQVRGEGAASCCRLCKICLGGSHPYALK